MSHQDALDALEARAQRAFADYRVSAFDHADVDALRIAGVSRLERIRWIGRKLTLAARSTEGFQEGREIVAAAEALLRAGDRVA